MFASALKAAGSAAAGLMSGATALPFTTESEYTSFAGKSPWRMYKGKKDVPDPKGGSNKVECTIFVHDLKGASPAQSSAARNAMKKLRTIKHPYLVKCLDAGEINDQKGGGTIYIVTEPVDWLAREQVILNIAEERTYWKEDAGKLLIGGFEAQGKAWARNGIPEDFEFDELPFDMQHAEPELERMFARMPAPSARCATRIGYASCVTVELPTR